MSAQPQPKLTPEEYLEIERAAEFKSEYHDGQMYAMPSGTFPHVRSTVNLTGELYAAIKRCPCQVISSDLRLRASPSGPDICPDLSVVCGELKFVEGRQDIFTNPTLVIEVLSPSTEAYDRGFKASQYRTIESLQEYALVAQHIPRIEVYRRQPSGAWLLTDSIGLESTVRFDSIDCALALSDIYEKITFNPDEALAKAESLLLQHPPPVRYHS
ncbi:MAG TPA: Uma2 family endonuclease [Bryobacteraceae bacterium]|jgi:Uma2 family endonuclease